MLNGQTEGCSVVCNSNDVISHSLALSYSKLHLSRPMLKLVLIDLGKHELIFRVPITILFRIPRNGGLELLALQSHLQEFLEERIEVGTAANFYEG